MKWEPLPVKWHLDGVKSQDAATLVRDGMRIKVVEAEFFSGGTSMARASSTRPTGRTLRRLSQPEFVAMLAFIFASVAGSSEKRLKRRSGRPTRRALLQRLLGTESHRQAFLPVSKHSHRLPLPPRLQRQRCPRPSCERVT